MTKGKSWHDVGGSSIELVIELTVLYVGSIKNNTSRSSYPVLQSPEVPILWDRRVNTRRSLSVRALVSKHTVMGATVTYRDGVVNSPASLAGVVVEHDVLVVLVDPVIVVSVLADTM